jgi:predicted PurR-regulated permease PerM
MKGPTYKSYIEWSSFLLMGIIIISSLFMNMIPMILSGFIVYMVIDKFHEKLQNKTPFAKKIVFWSVLMGTIFFLLFISSLVYWAFKSGSHHIRHEGVNGLLMDLEHVLAKIKDYLPSWISDYIPSSGYVVKDQIVNFLHERSKNILDTTNTSLRNIAKVIIGAILGLIIGFSSMKKSFQQEDNPLLSHYLMSRIINFYTVFSQVFLAQVKIALINTAFTGIYLLLILHLFGIHLPYSKTITLLTFVFGLIPVVGNLITNSVILLISLSISFNVAMASLAFLIVIHKTEYFLNAKIVGHEIKTDIWEILMAMIVMEQLFGIAGLIIAPVLYGYIKLELKNKNLV